MQEATPTRIGQGDALVLVDVQNDFLPGGSLAVSDGDQVVPVLNAYIERFRKAGLPLFATRDWHPQEHCSFRDQGGIWPAHCVVDSGGAAFAAELALPADAIIISKGTAAEKDAYSGFEDTDLAQRLRAAKVRRLFVGGLATDYCVLNTVKDAIAERFEVCLLEDAIRAVDVQPGDGDKARAEMRRLGARGLELEDLAG